MVRLVPRAALGEREGTGNRCATKFRTRCAKPLARSGGKKNDPDELWEQDEKLRKAVRPVLADVGETSQFLATRALVRTTRRAALFLDFLYKDLRRH